MKKNKVVLHNCPNFYKIINFEFYEDDLITERLISIYKDFIFTVNVENAHHLEIVQKIDYVLNKYIEDYYFRKEIQKDLLNFRVKVAENPNGNILQKVLKIFDAYESGYTRNIYFARWI